MRSSGVRLIMQAFLLVKNTDLIIDLQNDCIIHTNLLGCATTKRRGKTSPCLQESQFLAAILSGDDILRLRDASI